MRWSIIPAWPATNLYYIIIYFMKIFFLLYYFLSLSSLFEMIIQINWVSLSQNRDSHLFSLTLKFQQMSNMKQK
jgi:hypothetical protein